ncbi:porin [Pseudaestuariivita atlantica]|uniref:Porin domain-containing protein n=1 Tax=Pseudaestuariivita atlantica TaxID=1317121 RepID=A0A0L1JP70_9RHOB|nr:porin [Pseudaestuariivita atlantica]KNG93507.1 hypothetical protein ATO11_09810 [Pseudaestuariivita atlantica]
MKTVLFATTALVASAGIAAAQGVELSGSAEMGIVGGDAYGDVTQFWTDIDVTFSMSGETDNGLSFTASVDLDETDSDNVPSAAGGGMTQGGETISISAGGATLTMGDTDGAFDAALTEVAIGGAIDDAHTAHSGYTGNGGFDGTYDGQIARFSYAFEGFVGHISAEMDDTGTLDPVWGIGVAYTAELAGLDLGIGLGYQTTDDLFVYDEIMGISVSTTFDNGLQAILNYSQASDSNTGAADVTHMAIGLGYTMNALTIGVNYGQFDTPAGDFSGFGLAVNYDLGGGAAIQFGYSDSDAPAPFISRGDQFSLGVAMSF